MRNKAKFLLCVVTLLYIGTQYNNALADSIILNVEGYHQTTGNTCSAASSIMVLKYAGCTSMPSSDISYYNNVLGGKPWYSLMCTKLNEYLGGGTYTYTNNCGSLSDFESVISSSLQRGRPVIASMWPHSTGYEAALKKTAGYAYGGSAGHYVVIIGINNSTIMIKDPMLAESQTVACSTSVFYNSMPYSGNGNNHPLIYGLTQGSIPTKQGAEMSSGYDSTVTSGKWVYQVVTSDGVNIRKQPGLSAEIKTAIFPSTTFTVSEKTTVDGFTWGKGISSNGYDGWIVVDNSWTTLISSTSSTVSVTGVAVDMNSVSLWEYETTTLTATLSPSNATDQSVTWTSSNTAVATVTPVSGNARQATIKAIKAGSATITCKTSDGSKTATCAVTVKKHVTGLSLSYVNMTLKVGETASLTASVTPSDATNKTVHWSSKNTSIATVSNGVVKGVTAGSTTISAMSEDGGYTKECKVTVVVPVSSIAIKNTNLSLVKGNTASLAATVSPTNATNKNVNWTSSNTAVATVNSSGVVTAINAGSTTITCTAADGYGAKVTCSVNVIVNGTCGTNLKWSIDNNVLTISGTGDMSDYTQDNQPWRDYQASITKLDIKSGVTSIGQYAFYNMSALKEIVIPGTVKDIKYRAFLYCRSITQVMIPEGVQSIAFDAFAGCTQLQAIHFPDSLISLGGMAYQGARVSQVELGPGLKTIGGNPFCCDPNLTRFTVKEGAAIKVMDNSLYSLDGTRMVAYPCGHSATQYTVPMGTVILDDYCFYGITNLKEITVPDGVTKIGQYAFHKDTCLQKIYLPDSITDIGEEAFGGCTNLTIYCYNGSFAQQYAASNGIPYVIMSIPSGTCGDNLTWQIKSNVLTISGTGKMADYGDDSQPWHDSAASITKVVINDGVTSIGNSAFHGMQALKEVSVPDSLQSIGNRAFRLCTNLPNLDLPDTVTHIGSTVFDGCYAFTGFRIPKGVKVISERMFDSCRSIKEHAIPSGVQTIKNQAFAWNRALEKIIIPPSVTSIADDAFEGCEQVVIHCKDQSAAHKYAIKNNIPFVILDSSTVFDTPEYTGIEMDQTELTIRIGETYTLKAKAVPDSVSLDNVEWASSATDVAEVSSGEIRAVAEGTATITCYSIYEPSIKAECVVKVVEEHLTLSETDCTLKQGEVLNLQVKLQAFEDSITKLVWAHDDGIEFDYKESDNGGEASLYGLTPGVYHATCQTEDGRLSATCTIHIIPAEIERVVLNNETLDLLGGETAVLGAKVEPYYAYNEGFIWSSVDTGVAVVDSSGLVTADGPGNTTITCAAASAPEKTASCRVTVTVPVSSVVLNRSVYEFGDASEESIELTATLSPDNASNKSITWSSSNTHVATVLDGIVTPNAPGYARITCESVDGPKGVCDIVVHAEKIRKLPSSLKVIEAETFFGTALREVMIPDGVTSIESRAFANCGQLVLVDIPSSVSQIASDAFSGSNVAIVCSEACHATEYAAGMEIPYVIGSMPGEVIISTDSTTLLTGQSASLQARVLPDDAPKAVRWSIIDGGDIATIKSNGNKCTLTAVSAGRVTVSGTAINNTTGTIDITIIDHPTGFGIMFDANGGSVSTRSRSADFDVPLGTLPVPTREYYNFDGWYTQADDGTEVKADTVFNDNFMGDITLYAHWTRKVCTITYDANGGSCGTSSKSMNQGDAIGTLPTATRNYYTFDGWYTQASGGTKVAATTVFSSDTKLYAHWTRKTCTITFNANGGSCGTASKTMNQGDAIGTLPTATRDYYNFDGWYTQASGGTKAATTTVYSSNTTLYAHWTDKSWSGWVEASQLPSGNILTEKKTQYRYQDASYGGWSAWSGWDITRQGTSDVKKEESATVWYWYRFVCPYCGAHMHVWDKCHTWAGGCGKRIGSENYNVLWSTMPPSAGIQNWEGTGRIMDGGTPKSRWFFWKDASQGYPNGRSETGYRYATRTKSWGAWTSWSDTAVTGSSTRNVQTRTVYRYKVK